MSANKKISRKKFISKALIMTGGFCAAGILGKSLLSAGDAWAAKRYNKELPSPAFEARYYVSLGDKRIRCELCPRNCTVADLERGFCGDRENRDGTYYSLVYGRVSTMHNDPVEKKPFFHFLPGTEAFSLATAGCNFRCKFCQNWQIAQARPEELESVDASPADIVKYAKSYNSASIAFTYNEPTVFNEYVYDISALAKQNGIHPIVISNGYIEKKPLTALCGVISAMKIDLKAYNEKYYREVCSGHLKPVLNSISTLAEKGVWREIVYLVVTGLNDNEKEIREMSAWLIKNSGPLTPLHFSRFYPNYKLENLPPTPVAILERCRQAAMAEGLKYVYIGNVNGHEGENTSCHNCGKVIIRRVGFKIVKYYIEKGKCSFCKTKIPGVFA